MTFKEDVRELREGFLPAVRSAKRSINRKRSSFEKGPGKKLRKTSKIKLKKVGLKKSNVTLKLDLEPRRVPKERSVFFKVENIK